MKVKIGKSVKTDNEFHYYEVESDDIPFENLEHTKELLEKFVTGLINDYKPSKQSNGNENSKICYVCGKPIASKYKMCYECYKRHREIS